MFLNKDDLYEIEKVLDNYAGLISNNMNKTANLLINFDISDNNKDVKKSLKKLFFGLKVSYDKIKIIRDKLEKERFNSKNREV